MTGGRSRGGLGRSRIRPPAWRDPEFGGGHSAVPPVERIAGVVTGRGRKAFQSDRGGIGKDEFIVRVLETTDNP
jgi:hypothetical protein